MSRRCHRVIAGVIISVLIAACGQASESDGEGVNGTPTDVSLHLDWLWGAEHTGFVVAQEKGFFADAGLEVAITPGQGSVTTAALVGTEKSDFGIAAAAPTVMARAQGVPLVVAGTLLQQTPSALIIPVDSGIEDLEDLYGRTLGVDTASSIFTEWDAVAELNGVDRSQIEEVDAGDADLQAMLDGKLDATIGFGFNQGLEFELRGGEARLMEFGNLGLEIPGSSIVTSQNFASNSPEVVEAFVSAVKQGWQYTIENPEEALHIFQEAHPDVDAEYSRRKLPMVLDLLGDPEEIGHSSEAKWLTLIDLYESNGLLPASIELDNFLYLNG